MEYKLRPYQQRSVDVAVSFFRNEKLKKNGIIILPTGSGKSLVIANIVKELDADTIIFQPSKEILEQNFEKYISYGFPASIYSASAGEKIISQVTFATIGSCVNKVEYFRRFKYIIVDECHGVNAKGGMYEKFISALGVKVLGLTATPYRLSTDGFGGSILKFITRTRPRVFSLVLDFVQNKELFDNGFLSKLEYDMVPGFNSEQIKLNSTGADYDDNSLQLYFDNISHNQRIINKVKSLLPLNRRGILVFTKFVSDSEKIKSALSPYAQIVTGETPKKEREKILADFRSGKIKVVCNVGVLTTGFDYPELDTIILGRPTMSLVLYYQMIGRGIRPHSDKHFSMIVDMCDNHKKFGRVEDLMIYENNGKPFVGSGTKQLTNAYFTEEKPIPSQEEFTMPFGKYKGKTISLVPVEYLEWMKKDVSMHGQLKTEVERVLAMQKTEA